MKFKEAYRAVHNMIAQNEALLALREPLEKAKEVEDFLSSMSDSVEAIKAEITELESYRNEVVKKITQQQSEAEIKATKKLEALHSELNRTRQNFDKDQGQRAVALEDQITQHKLDLIRLEDSIKAKSEEERSLIVNLRDSRAEFQSVKQSLARIKNSIGE